ncbi:hypothetical protein ACFC58_40630 [Kitasatospora purpeofusca]|uniref:hypothetical protein n=1 Tax=Kitasatospora purpeofusca TaxID=67352 RepID=UPI0035DB61C4
MLRDRTADPQPVTATFTRRPVNFPHPYPRPAHHPAATCGLSRSRAPGKGQGAGGDQDGAGAAQVGGEPVEGARGKSGVPFLLDPDGGARVCGLECPEAFETPLAGIGAVGLLDRWRTVGAGLLLCTPAR